MDPVKIIKQAAEYADTAGRMGAAAWEWLCFKPGEVTAQTPLGGIRLATELEFEAVVPAKHLLAALKSVSADPLFVLVDDGSRLEMRAGRTCVTVETIHAANVPKFFRPEKKAKWVPGTGLDQVHRAAWATCKEVSRAFLQVVAFGADGMTATTGKAAARIQGVDFSKIFGGRITLYPEMLADLPTEVWVSVSGNRAFIATDPKGQNYRSCLIPDLQFPEMGGTLDPIRNYPAAVVDTEAFGDLLKRAKAAGTHIKLQVVDDVIECDVAELGTGAKFAWKDSIVTESCTVKKHDGARLDLATLSAAAAAIDAPQTTLHFAGAMEPVGVSSGNVFSVITPMFR